MYRAIGYKVKTLEIDMNDKVELIRLLNDTEIEFNDGNIFLDGKNVNKEIRTPEISTMASKCSALKPVREKLVALQRVMGQKKSVIMDGRDIGTNVLIDAEYKFYMTASPEERAQRRYDELKSKGQDVKYDDVLVDINERDNSDMTRDLNPLRKADDAIELDTTGMSIKEVTNTILKEVKQWQ